ncbi:unnamed protein product [Caenorhabditis sp. 36 PRJEB53466]|nr:unnamed protein product [Caenorhabditis sp. 36 PRJEB53466]
MKPDTYPMLKTSLQLCSLFFALLFNSLLIFLVKTKSPKKMGTYKYLMIYFALFAIFFTCLENVVQPYAHTHGCSFLVIMRLAPNSLINPKIAFFLICFLTGCFGFTIALISIHFVFRLFALERRGKLRYFDRKYLPFWFSIPVFVGANHTLLSVLVFAPNEHFSDYVRKSVFENYGLLIDDQVYMGAYFYPPDASGTPKLDWTVALGFVDLFLTASVSFSILIYCGSRSYCKIKNLMKEGRSRYTRNLQKQLYKALVVQACIPTVLMFVPVGIFISAPLLYLNVEFLSKLTTITYAVYPAIEPIPIIFIVDDYRKATVSMLKLDWCKRNKVSNTNEEVSTTENSGNAQI